MGDDDGKTGMGGKPGGAGPSGPASPPEAGPQKDLSIPVDLDASAVEESLDRVPSDPGSAAVGADLPAKDYDPTRDRETKRGEIALWLIGLLAAIIFGGLLIALIWVLWGDADTARLDALKSIVEMLLTPMVGLVGAVTGFYFGNAKS